MILDLSGFLDSFEILIKAMNCRLLKINIYMMVPPQLYFWTRQFFVIESTHVLSGMLHAPSEAYPWFLAVQWPCGLVPAVPLLWLAMTVQALIHLCWPICGRSLRLQSSHEHRGKRREPWHRTSLRKTRVKHEGVGWLTQGQLAGAQGQSTLGQGIERINHDQTLTPSSAWF